MPCDSKMIGCRVKLTEIWVSGKLVTHISWIVYLWPFRVQCYLGVIQCPCVKITCNSKRAKIWDSPTLVKHVWSTFDPVVFKFILGSFGALAFSGGDSDSSSSSLSTWSPYRKEIWRKFIAVTLPLVLEKTQSLRLVLKRWEYFVPIAGVWKPGQFRETKYMFASPGRLSLYMQCPDWDVHQSTAHRHRGSWRYKEDNTTMHDTSQERQTW